MTDETFSTEPVIGHHVSAEMYEVDTELSRALDRVADRLGTPRLQDERIRITVGDVDWNEGKTISLSVETFEELIEWYESR